MKPRAFAIVIGLVLVIAGFVLGLTHPSVTVGTDRLVVNSSATVSCGATFGSSSSVTPLGSNSVEIATKCADAEGTRSTWTWVLLGLGAVLTLGGLLIRPKPVVPATPVVPAGFYPDPTGVVRFWDGTAWTSTLQSEQTPPVS